MPRPQSCALASAFIMIHCIFRALKAKQQPSARSSPPSLTAHGNTDFSKVCEKSSSCARHSEVRLWSSQQIWGERCFFHVIVLSTGVPTTPLTMKNSSDLMHRNFGATNAISLINPRCQGASRNCTVQQRRFSKQRKRPHSPGQGFPTGAHNSADAGLPPVIGMLPTPHLIRSAWRIKAFYFSSCTLTKKKTHHSQIPHH